MPNQADSRPYCSPCKRHLLNEQSYTLHLNIALRKRRIITRSSIPTGALPDEFDPNGFCCACNKAFKTTHNYLQHLKAIHNMKLTPLKKLTPNPNITPDPYNKNHHCDSCGLNGSNFMFHLKQKHKMNAPDLRGQRATPNPNISPDINDPNLYCKSCQVKFKSIRTYCTHLQGMHKMELALLRQRAVFDPTISSDDSKNPNNTSSAICKFKYSTKVAYQQYMRKYHKDGKGTPVVRRRARTINRNIQPDSNDPNFFCRSCQKQYPSRHSFSMHIYRSYPRVPIKGRRDLPLQ